MGQALSRCSVHLSSINLDESGAAEKDLHKPVFLKHRSALSWLSPWLTRQETGTGPLE